ncbi:transmembrane protein, putative (macronuclear) [Tetrahymena thermophila SB210]|uniref:Transmembrane protein, putative n=1 Tax=Tetrahymena thermophila (strain SB210) TaxID=312017 RepID=W7XJZ5_TETTS|nr:transmembrane protein, putative [Tetrahymena thermophila SB210]EWS76081.1 transmembrane protein, putative [Tetrahymena thermophila SB210]|eukprot:XP_012651388.1 transmembrane protein, putative [Tetrahymena thermophila SB210]
MQSIIKLQQSLCLISFLNCDIISFPHQNHSKNCIVKTFLIIFHYFSIVSIIQRITIIIIRRIRARNFKKLKLVTEFSY